MAKSPVHPKSPSKPEIESASARCAADDPALAEILNPAINRGDVGMGSGTGLQPPPDNSKDRRSGGEAAIHRSRSSTPKDFNDGAPPSTLLRPNPQPPGTRLSENLSAFEEAPQTNYNTSATIPTLDPELAKQLGYDVDDDESFRPARNKMESLGVKATADALENLMREGRPEFRKEDGSRKVWTPHRPPRPEKSEGGALRVNPNTSRRAISPRSRNWSKASAQRPHAGAARRHRFWQDLHDGKDRGDTAPRASPEQDARRAACGVQEFLPRQRGQYFVSYYDYHQPEAYVPRTDTIEKDSSINEQIDRMRHSATRALESRRCDYRGVGVVHLRYWFGRNLYRDDVAMKKGERIDQRQLIADLVALNTSAARAISRAAPSASVATPSTSPAHYEDRSWRVNMFGDTIESIEEFDPLTGHKQDELEFIKIYANSHYVTPRPTLIQAIKGIKHELKWRLDQLHDQGRLLEAQRLEQRTTFDLEMMEATGSCAGSANYSRYLTGRKPGEPPPTLFEYVPDNALVFADESHVTVPQIGGMFKGDFRRKATLAEYGFRLPSCMDNRPLRFEEWDMMRPQSVAVSATPGGWERKRRRVCRAGHSSDRADRSAGEHPPRPHAGGRSCRRVRATAAS